MRQASEVLCLVQSGSCAIGPKMPDLSALGRLQRTIAAVLSPPRNLSCCAATHLNSAAVDWTATQAG